MVKQALVVSRRSARRFFIVDIENMLGGACHVTDDAVRFAERVLCEELWMRDVDQVLIGVTAVQAIFPVSRVFPGKAKCIKCGADGAELVILGSIDPVHVARCFDEVVIVSGDGMFAHLAAQLAYYGTRVIVAGHHGGMSARLRLAAHATHYFTTPLNEMKAAA